jgi:hypothetical protein
MIVSGWSDEPNLTHPGRWNVTAVVQAGGGGMEPAEKK